jgi:hypothetical protein
MVVICSAERIAPGRTGFQPVGFDFFAVGKKSKATGWKPVLLAIAEVRSEPGATHRNGDYWEVGRATGFGGI